MTCRTRPQPQTTWTQEGGNATLSSNTAARKAVVWARPKMVNAVTAAILGRGAEVFYSNAGGNAQEGDGWIAALKRYGMWSNSPGGVGGPTYHNMNVGEPFHAILDPLFPVVPMILRVRDIVQVTRSVGATWGQVGFTLGGGYVGQDGIITDAYRSVGFVSYGGGTWKTYKSGNVNIAAGHVVDTGRLITDVCELMFELDGAQKQVRYYIDGALVDTYVVPNDPAAVALNRQENLYWTLRSDAGVTLRFHHGLGLGPIIETEMLS